MKLNRLVSTVKNLDENAKAIKLNFTTVRPQTVLLHLYFIHPLSLLPSTVHPQH